MKVSWTEYTQKVYFVRLPSAISGNRYYVWDDFPLDFSNPIIYSLLQLCINVLAGSSVVIKVFSALCFRAILVGNPHPGGSCIKNESKWLERGSEPKSAIILIVIWIAYQTFKLKIVSLLKISAFDFIFNIREAIY